jgi:hypothetical protein
MVGYGIAQNTEISACFVKMANPSKNLTLISNFECVNKEVQG